MKNTFTLTIETAADAPVQTNWIRNILRHSLNADAPYSCKVEVERTDSIDENSVKLCDQCNEYALTLVPTEINGRSLNVCNTCIQELFKPES